MDPVLYQFYDDTGCCQTPTNLYIITWKSWHFRTRVIDAMDSSNWQLLFVAGYSPCWFSIKYPTHIYHIFVGYSLMLCSVFVQVTLNFFIFIMKIYTLVYGIFDFENKVGDAKQIAWQCTGSVVESSTMVQLAANLEACVWLRQTLRQVL